MTAPKVHHLQHVHQGAVQQQAQHPHVMVGRHGDYTYRAETGRGQGGERSPRQGGSGGAPRGQGAQRRLTSAPPRPQRRPVNAAPAESGGQEMDDSTDEGNKPFDPFKHLAMMAQSQQQGGQGQGRDRRGSGGQPKGKVAPPLPRPDDPSGQWMKMQLPGAAMLLGKAGPPASGMELLGAMASVVLGAVHHAMAGRQKLALGQTLLASSLHAMRRPAVPLPTLNLLMVKNLLLSQQRGHFDGRSYGGDRPEWLGDRLALAPLHVLNIGRPRTDNMRETANSRKEFLMRAQPRMNGGRS